MIFSKINLDLDVIYFIHTLNFLNMNAGIILIINIIQYQKKGKYFIVFLFFAARKHAFAQAIGLAAKNIPVFPKLIGVSIYPNFITVTETLSSFNAERNPSQNGTSADFA